MLKFSPKENASQGGSRKPFKAELLGSESQQKAARAQAQALIELAEDAIPSVRDLPFHVAATCEILKVKKKLGKETWARIYLLGQLLLEPINEMGKSDIVTKANVLNARAQFEANNPEAKERYDLLGEINNQSRLQTSEYIEYLELTPGINEIVGHLMDFGVIEDLAGDAYLLLAERYLSLGDSENAEKCLQFARYLPNYSKDLYLKIIDQIKSYQRTGQIPSSSISPATQFMDQDYILGAPIVDNLDVFSKYPDICQIYTSVSIEQFYNIIQKEWAAAETEPDLEVKFEHQSELCLALASIGKIQEAKAHIKTTLEDLRVANLLSSESDIYGSDYDWISVAKMLCGEPEEALKLSDSEMVRLAAVRYYCSKAMEVLDQADVN